MFHPTRQVLAPFASSACAHLLLPNCAVWLPWSDCPSSALVSVVVELHWQVLGELLGGFLAQSLVRCPAQVLQPIRYGFHRNIPNWTTSFHHTTSRHGEAHCPSQRSRSSRHVVMFSQKNELVREPLADTTFEEPGEHEWRNGVQQMNARVNVTKRKCSFTSVVGLPTLTGAEPTMLPSNMARTGAPSTNTLEIDVFCCSVDGPTRPVSCQITLCWTWNQSDVEQKCKCASLSSVRTTLK